MAHGVSSDRLVFSGKLPDKSKHLGRLQLMDLALDTLVYNGQTTTRDALWAGVPVITIHGSHIASRVSASILFAMGLNEGLV
ncbi:MAG: UDP-N-acetylglucosamine-peptide N-acetylglucosaminyltransferase, partial [Betaproteobacteria bacterium]|nr:UDP-N-acetylglucosamine-peptide N-acetylglucosaminyltransferase [Betaproteobacteria bacterium]